MPPSTTEPLVDLEQQPGHLIRRLQQAAVALFMEATRAQDLTPVQFAALAAVQREPGMDQRSLARRIGFDTSTTGGVIDRLEGRGLMTRSASATDRRVRLLHLTDAGRDLLEQAVPAMLGAQERILQPLPESQRANFVSMLRTLVGGHSTGAQTGGTDPMSAGGPKKTGRAAQPAGGNSLRQTQRAAPKLRARTGL